MRNRAPWLTIFLHAFQQFNENDLFTSAAAMSYFGLLTLFPALLVLLALSNRFAGSKEMLSQIVQAYPGSRDFLRGTIQSLSSVGSEIIISCVIVVFWAGSWVFSVIEHALTRIWGTTPRTFLHGRLLTLAMVGIVGILLALSVFITSVAVTLQELASRLSPRQLQNWQLLGIVGSAFWQIVFAALSLIVTITLFIIVYRFMPNAAVRVRETLPGAILGGMLWEAAKYLFAWSLQFFHYSQIYGSVGAVVAVLTWGYFSSLILMFGAQLSAVFHHEQPTEVVRASLADAATAPAP